MKTSNRKAIILIAVVILLSVTVGVSSEIFPMESNVFIQASVALASDMYASFDASLHQPYPTIAVTSCTLQKQVSGAWITVGSVPAPSYVARNTSWYAADASYSTYCTKGQTYRIKAVFSAGGESVTRYSLGVTYQ